MGFLREQWTEAEVLNLPEGEHNYFDRKSGKLFADKGKLYAALAKALSAFANSGGGHLILGQEDDGTIEGIPCKERRTDIREWLEQKLPNLVSYPLEAFRVHTVIRDPTSSQIPADKQLVVIDVGESRLAPHQAASSSESPQYYYRQGGKSLAAPHHYLEALRNRLTFAVLEAQLESVTVGHAHPEETSCRAVVEVAIHFVIRNVSRVACYKWDIDVTLQRLDDSRVVTPQTYPRLNTGKGGIYLDTTILPSRETRRTIYIGFKVFGCETYRADIQQCLLPIEVHYYPISENHLGESKSTKIGERADYGTLCSAIDKSLSEAGISL